MRRLLRFWPWAALTAMAACILAMNVWCVPAFDELMYAFEGLRTPLDGNIPSPRVASLADIVRQQWGDYFHPGANGRVWIHGIVALFAGFRLYLLFDIINTVMWFLLVWLMLREAHLPLRRDGKAFLAGALVLWWCLWMAETCCMNAAFAVNYLWTACATVAMMALWRRAKAWWWVPLAFFYGWSHEAFALPMLAALAGGALLRSVAECRLALTPQQAVAWALMLAGACFLCFAPSTRSRAGKQVTFVGGESFIEGVLLAHVSVFLLLGTLTVAIGLAWALWRYRSHLRDILWTNMEWLLFLVAAEALFVVLTGTGSMGLRMAMPILLAGCVLLFRLRGAFAFSPWIRGALLGFIGLWLGGGSQCKSMQEKRLLRC